MPDALASLKAFDVTGSTSTLWVFKKSGAAGSPPVFSGRWVETTAELDAALKGAVTDALGGVAELIDYDLLAQNNEASALELTAAETYAPLISEACADPTAKRKVKNLKEITNSEFYVIKLVADGDALLAVRKTDASWGSKRSVGLRDVVFVENILTIDDRPRFSVSKKVDFLVMGEIVAILSKTHFESVLSYKEAHTKDFGELKAESEFVGLFTEVETLDAFIGSNKIHLRRASAIRAKGHYKDAEFMTNLRAEAKGLGLSIAFDKDGRIVPTAESCRDIFRALLDHRLASRLSKGLYDVESAALVKP